MYGRIGLTGRKQLAGMFLFIKIYSFLCYLYFQQQFLQNLLKQLGHSRIPNNWGNSLSSFGKIDPRSWIWF